MLIGLRFFTFLAFTICITILTRLNIILTLFLYTTTTMLLLLPLLLLLLLLLLVLSRQTGFFECEHPFIDKPIFNNRACCSKHTTVGPEFETISQSHAQQRYYSIFLEFDKIEQLRKRGSTSLAYV